MRADGEWATSFLGTNDRERAETVTTGLDDQGQQPLHCSYTDRSVE